MACSSGRAAPARALAGYKGGWWVKLRLIPIALAWAIGAHDMRMLIYMHKPVFHTETTRSRVCRIA